MSLIANTTPDGDTIGVVGHIHAFPRHPEAGTPVTPFPGRSTTPPGEGVGRYYALVSVGWATQITTVDLDTGARDTRFDRTGSLGAPTGTTWYLAPVTYDTSAGVYCFEGRHARGFRDADLPHIPGLAAPTRVPIHDHPIC